MKIFLVTFSALVCFAFNSILCRLALGQQAIDASSFTTIRLVSGALALIAISSVSIGRYPEKSVKPADSGNWFSAVFLFAYAICFSFAYLDLTTATGALILFGSVQATMLLSGLVTGERPGIFEWLGLALALGGLVYLVFPGLESPPLFGSLLMASAGIAWGFYTLRGKVSKDPLADTRGNFARAVPLVLFASLPFIYKIEITAYGALLAALSGVVASGIGYSIWYAALRHHSSASAAVVQLSVPVIAAAGGLVLMSEPISIRLVVSSGFVLGGIGLAISLRTR